MRILIVFIAIALYIFSVAMFISKTENKINRKYNACKKYNRHSYKKHNINRKKYNRYSYQKHNINRKKHKGDL